jgi:hypothetical protein
MDCTETLARRGRGIKHGRHACRCRVRSWRIVVSGGSASCSSDLCKAMFCHVVAVEVKDGNVIAVAPEPGLVARRSNVNLHKAMLRGEMWVGASER